MSALKKILEKRKKNGNKGVIREKIDKTIDINIEELEFSDIKINNYTIGAKFDSELKLTCIYKYLKLDEYITCIKYKKDMKGTPLNIKKKNEDKKRFPSNMFIYLKLPSGEFGVRQKGKHIGKEYYCTIMLYDTGVANLTGCKSKHAAYRGLQILRDKLLNIKGTEELNIIIYKSLIVNDKLVYTQNGKIFGYIENESVYIQLPKVENNTAKIGNINIKIKPNKLLYEQVDCSDTHLTSKEFNKLNKNIYNFNGELIGTHIIEFNRGFKSKYKELTYKHIDDNNLTCIKGKNSNQKDIDLIKIDYIQNTLTNDRNKIIGYISTNIDESKIIDNTNTKTIKKEYKAYNNNFELPDISSLKLNLINCSHSLKTNYPKYDIEIDRQRLLHILFSDNINARLNTTAVNISYYYNENNLDNDGICKCNIKCEKNENKQKWYEGKCICITIMVHRTGKIQIQSKFDEKYVNLIYEFINTYIIKNSHNVLSIKL